MDAHDERFRKILRSRLSCKLLFDEPAERHTSIGVGGRADVLVYPRSRDELEQILSCLRETGTPFIPVGNWTNIIVKDGGYRGAIISLQNLHHLLMKEQNNGHSLIDAEAGTLLADIVRTASDASLTGVEFCAGIPGSVGGAVRMNAGAYGNEVKDVIDAVSVMYLSGEILEFKRDALSFEYRNMEMPEDAIIIGASFLLTKGEKAKIQKRIREIVDTRKKKHPLEYRNAGSIFKNPEGIPAGQIIDALGLKGTRLGGAEISEKHGNFIVNKGNARAADILALIDIVKEKAWTERGIQLETEVRIVGEDA